MSDECAAATAEFKALNEEQRQIVLNVLQNNPSLRLPPNNPQRHLYWRFFDCMVDRESGRYLPRITRFVVAARHRRRGFRRA